MPPRSSLTQLRNGKYFDLLNPDPELIDSNDLCDTLAGIRRFNGKTRGHYSVAEHSLLVLEAVRFMHCNVPRPVQLAALLHDAAETYTGDIISPVKDLVRPLLEPVERRIERAIAKRFGFFGHDLFRDPRIKEADLAALEWERRNVCVADPGDSTPPEWPQPSISQLMFVRYVNDELPHFGDMTESQAALMFYQELMILYPL